MIYKKSDLILICKYNLEGGLMAYSMALYFTHVGGGGTYLTTSIKKIKDFITVIPDNMIP